MTNHELILMIGQAQVSVGPDSGCTANDVTSARWQHLYLEYFSLNTVTDCTTKGNTVAAIFCS